MKRDVILAFLLLLATASLAYSDSVFVFGWIVNGTRANEAQVGDSVSATVRLISEPMTRYRVDVLRVSAPNDAVVASHEWTYDDLGSSMSVVSFIPQEPGTYYLETHRREGNVWTRLFVLEEDTFPGRLTVFPPSRWRVEVVDTPPTSVLARWPALSLESSGRPHIVYFSTVEEELVTIYASRNGPDDWQLESVPELNHHPEPSLAFDSDDNPHVFVPKWDGGLAGHYGYWNGTEWLVTPIGNQWRSTETRYSDMALDSQDRPHITYKTKEVRDGAIQPSLLKYAYLFDSLLDPWVITDPPAASAGQRNRGLWSSIAIDRQDTIHITHAYSGVFYTKGERHPLNYTNIAWETLAIDGGIEPDIAVDHDGDPHISYASGAELKYARRDGSEWVFETADSGEDVGRYSSITMDSYQNPQICYYDETARALKYIERRTGGWLDPETIDSTMDTGANWCWSTSMAVDVYDYVHISYYTSDGVKYATNSPHFVIGVTATDPAGHFSATINAGEIEEAPVSNHTEVRTSNIASYNVESTTNDTVLVIEGQLEDGDLPGEIVLEIDLGNVVFTYGVKVAPYQAEQPVASVTGAANVGVAFFSVEAPVEFDPSGSSCDPHMTIERYDWDFDGDGVIDETRVSPEPVSWSYPRGTHHVTLEVTDSAGQTGSKTHPVVVFSGWRWFLMTGGTGVMLVETLILILIGILFARKVIGISRARP